MKLAKLSLAAIVTIGALTTVASAVDLEKAVKGTKLAGYVRYRHNVTWDGFNDSPQRTESDNEYKGVFNFIAPVNDMVKANVKFVTIGATSDTTGDINPGVVTKFANFIISPADNVTVIVGKQALVTPFADPADQSGTGIVAALNLGNIKLYAGAYSNTNAGAVGVGSDITAFGATADLGMVNGEAWYAVISPEDTDKDVTAMYVEANAKISIVSLQVAHASVDYKDILAANNDMKEQTRFVASANLGMINGTIGYVKTGEEGGNVGLGDGDEKANFDLQILSANDLYEGSLVYLAAGTKLDKVSGKVEYLTGSAKNGAGSNTDVKVNELKFTVGYAMSKNFNLTGWYSAAAMDVDGLDETKQKQARFEAKYTF